MNAFRSKPYFRRMLTIALCTALPLQALLLVPLAFVSEMGNFDFLGYILVAGFSVLNWIFVFWRTVHLGLTTKCAVQGEKLLLSRGFLRKEILSLSLPQADKFIVKPNKTTKDAYLTYNGRTFFLPCLEEETLAQISAFVQPQTVSETKKDNDQTEELSRASYFAGQSAYLVIKRAVEAFVLGYLIFVAISAAFYGNVLIVCRGEYFTALFFALGVGALFPALLFVPGGQHSIVIQDEKVCITKAPLKPAKFYAKEDLLRVKRTVTPLMKVLGACRLELVFDDASFVLYLRNLDFYYLDFFFAQSLDVPRAEEKSAELDDAFYVHPHYGNALFIGLKTFTVLALISLFALPVLAGVLHANGITLQSFLPENTFVIRIFVLFVLLITASIVVGGITALGYLIYLATANANYRFAVANDTVLIHKGKFTLRTNLLRRDSLRLVCEKRSAFSILGKNKTISLSFAEGKRRFTTTFGGQAVTEEECTEFGELVPGFAPAACTVQPFKRFLPAFTLIAICAFAPIVLFSFLMSPAVAVLAIPTGLAFYLHCKHYSFAETEECITLQTGVLTLRRTTIRKADVCAVRTHKAIIARAFQVNNAEICLSFTESSLNLTALTKKERDIMANLIKAVKNN